MERMQRVAWRLLVVVGVCSMVAGCGASQAAGAGGPSSGAVPPGAGSGVVPPGSLADPRLSDEQYTAYLFNRYRGVEPERVAPRERRDYFEYLKRLRDPDQGRPTAEVSPNAPGIPHGDAIRSAVSLWNLTLASDAPLAQDIHDWLVGKVTQYRIAYIYGGTTLSSPVWRSGERAWIGWMSGAISSLQNEQLREVTRVVLETVNQVGPMAFDGLDPVALGSYALERRCLSPNEGRDVCDQARKYALSRRLATQRLDQDCTPRRM